MLSKTLPTLLGLPKPQLIDLLSPVLNLPKEKYYVYDQLYTALYTTGNQDFSQMQCLSAKHKLLLQQNTEIGLPTVKKSLLSIDGTRKWLLNFKERADIETVYIPEVNKHTHNSIGTLCVSSQVGCSLKCSFCHTGTQKFQRNLTFSEIIAQVMHTMSELGDFKPGNPRKLTNIVFMGQGEPLYNYKNVSKAVKFINETFKYAPHRTTISTSGLVPLMGVLGSELGANLAVSLHAVNDELRDVLVPLNKQYNIKKVLVGCRDYAKSLEKNSFRRRRITFEYVMLKSVNDSDIEAKELVRLLKGIDSHVNLIPFNVWPGTIYETSEMDQILNFQKILYDGGIRTHIRMARGADIMAACGQLKSLEDSKTKF
jgi:23S rRNA (adenine2503-C2)-methyltransferase